MSIFDMNPTRHESEWERFRESCYVFKAQQARDPHYDCKQTIAELKEQVRELKERIAKLERQP